MTIKKLSFIALGLGLCSLGTQAQQISDPTVLTKSDLMVQSILSNPSSAQAVQQQGAVATYQLGEQNTLRVSPQRGENELRLVQQGNSNNMDLQLLGEGNQFQFSQLGNNNDLQLRNLQSNNNTLQVVQRGSNNQLIDNGSGLLNRPLRIEQSGGMKVLINGQ